MVGSRAEGHGGCEKEAEREEKQENTQKWTRGKQQEEERERDLVTGGILQRVYEFLKAKLKNQICFKL